MLLRAAGRGTVVPEPREDTPLTGKTINRANIVESIHREVGLSQDELARLVKSLLDEIVNGLAEGVPVKISSFGSFTVRQKAPRMGRNPATGELVPIPPRRVVMFKASAGFKERITRALGDLQP